MGCGISNMFTLHGAQELQRQVVPHKAFMQAKLRSPPGCPLHIARTCELQPHSRVAAAGLSSPTCGTGTTDAMKHLAAAASVPCQAALTHEFCCSCRSNISQIPQSKQYLPQIRGHNNTPLATLPHTAHCIANCDGYAGIQCDPDCLAYVLLALLQESADCLSLLQCQETQVHLQKGT